MIGNAWILGVPGTPFFMENLIKGKKLNMTQIFMDDGKVVPVTLIKSEDGLNADLIDKDVIVVGISKGKGFAGVMKKWNFKGGQATHGQSNKPRQAGSIGASTPGRVFKGKKMAGRLGGKRVTVKGLKIVGIEAEKNELMVSGPVPGARNSKVVLRII